MRILLISDMHCGSAVSIAHPQAKVNQEGGTIGLNKIQQYVLYPIWKKMCEGEPYDRVVVNGDLVDGKQHKSGNMGLWTADFQCQAECAARLLDMIPLKKGGQIDIVAGTDYHRGNNMCADREVVNQFNRLQDGKTSGKNANYQGLEYVLEVEGLRFHISHTIGGGMYHGTVLNKELMFMHLYKYKYDGMIRGHRHNFHMDWDGSCFCLMLPCWKGRDDYEKKAGLKWALNKVGWVDLTIGDGQWDVTPHLTKLKSQIREVKG